LRSFWLSQKGVCRTRQKHEKKFILKIFETIEKEIKNIFCHNLCFFVVVVVVVAVLISAAKIIFY